MGIIKFYIVYLLIFTVITYFLVKYMNKKTDEQRMTVLKIIAGIGIILHVIKPLFFPYNGHIDVTNGNPDIFNYPSILRKITIENVSAATTVLFLPILMSKRKFLLDYITIIGFLGGFLAMAYPAEVIFQTFDSLDVVYPKTLFAFDSIRFYTVHYIPLFISSSLLYYGLHELDLKRRYFFSLSVVSMLGLLFLNELMIDKLGWLDDIKKVMLNDYGVSNLFYNRNYRNFSFVFGVPDNFKKVGIWIDILVPKFMKSYKGFDSYIPVIWIIIPAFIYGPLLYRGFHFVASKVNFGKVREVKLEELESVQ